MNRASVAALTALLCIAAPAGAQVRLLIRADGSKVIYNLPTRNSRPARGGADYGWLARQRNRVTAYDDLIDRYATQFHVDPILVKAVMVVESNANPFCISSKGARGLMQLMPETAKRFNVKKIHDPEENIRGGVQYLATLLTMFRGDLSRALAAYNAGENAVAKYNGIPPYEETGEYVKRALTVYHGEPYGAGSISIRGGGKGRKLAGGFKGKSTATSLLASIQPRPDAILRVR